MVVVAFLEVFGAAGGADVEVVPPQRGGDEESEDGDHDRGGGPLRVVHAGDRRADCLSEDEDHEQAEALG